jgi:predicted AAA+ superfamily ATPase
MRPFSLVERGGAQPVVSLADLLSGSRPDFAGSTSVSIEDYAEEIVVGGIPALRGVPSRFRRAAWDGYLTEIFERDLPEVGRSVRRPQTLRAWLRSYAAATSSTASYTAILDDATVDDTDKPTKVTALAWRELLHRMWLLDPLPAWDDPRRRLSRLSSVSKHHLADPALAAHLLGVSADTLLTHPHAAGLSAPRAGTLFGVLFESLVTLSVRAYAEPLDVTVGHLRTRNGDHEVDLVITRPDGRCVALEVKSAPQIGPGDVKHLRWLKAQLGDDLLDAAVITTGPAAYRRTEDGIGVIPASLLGAA